VASRVLIFYYSTLSWIIWEPFFFCLKWLCCAWGSSSVWRSSLWTCSLYMLHSLLISIQWLSIVNRPRDLPSCTLAHQPSTLSHSPRMFCIRYKNIFLLIRSTLDLFRAKDFPNNIRHVVHPFYKFLAHLVKLNTVHRGPSSRPCSNPKHLKLLRHLSCSLHFELTLRDVTTVVWLIR
jgi:hypothetical protein